MSELIIIESPRSIEARREVYQPDGRLEYWTASEHQATRTYNLREINLNNAFDHGAPIDTLRLLAQGLHVAKLQLPSTLIH
jgi:hypothetical protein